MTQLTPKKSINSGLKIFEQTKKIEDLGNEFWTARDLAKILEYSEFRHFLPVIAKAHESCEKSKKKASDHFEEFLEMIELAKGACRKVINIKLSRYACYLIVQNSDPAKEASVITPIDYAIFQNHGYKGLYGNLDSKDIHKKKSLKKTQKILDHMGSTELAANLFRATQKEEKIRREKILGKEKANKTHFDVGVKVLKTIKDLGGEMPENLPTVQAIQKIENKNIRKSPIKKPKIANDKTVFNSLNLFKTKKLNTV